MTFVYGENMQINQVMQDREDRYRTVNSSCGTVEYFDSRKHKVLNNRCMRFSCGRCRNQAISNAMNDVVKAAYKFRLKRHFVITLQGKGFRKYVDPDHSFIYLARKWNIFKTYFNKKFGKKLCYIAFFRSQESGYAHMHILSGDYIPIKWIKKTFEGMKLGFAKIDYVDIHHVKNYLSKYWYKEHEWFIPENKKHFTTSRDIKLGEIYEKNKDYFMLHPIFDYTNVYWKLDGYYNQIEEKTGYPPPLDFMLSEYYKINEGKINYEN